MKAKKFVQITKNGYGETVHQSFIQYIEDDGTSVIKIIYRGLVKEVSNCFTILRPFKDYFLVENIYAIKTDSLKMAINNLDNLCFGIQAKLNMNNYETMG